MIWCNIFHSHSCFFFLSIQNLNMQTQFHPECPESIGAKMTVYKKFRRIDYDFKLCFDDKWFGEDLFSCR